MKESESEYTRMGHISEDSLEKDNTLEKEFSKNQTDSYMMVSSRTDCLMEEEVKNGLIKLSIQVNMNKAKNKEWADYSGQSTLNNQTKNKPKDGKMARKKVRSISMCSNSNQKKILKKKLNQNIMKASLIKMSLKEKEHILGLTVETTKDNGSKEK